MAGRTGGPLMPLLAVAKQLPEYEPIVIGVKGGFEESVCTKQNLKLEYLPEVKLSLLSFGRKGIIDWLSGLVSGLGNILLLALSLFQCQRLLLKYKPKAIFSTGSFLAVPMIYAASFLKGLKILDTKIIIHQQDPLPGLANRLTIKLADYQTCVFPYTQKNFSSFINCKLIPNPIDTDRFDNLSLKNIGNWQLADFLKNISNKPLLLIFGGGSGAKFINDWTWSNLPVLLENFRVLHLCGTLQHLDLQKLQELHKNDDYLLFESLVEYMPHALTFADLVICRAGLSSITELDYLCKKALLVPIPDSHQEINAEQVKDRFTVLNHKNSMNWLNSITQKAEESGVDYKTIQRIRVSIKDNMANYIKEVKKVIKTEDQVKL